jgi:tRNA/rRNA methyltransferase
MSLLQVVTTRFVLVQTLHPGNVGAAARAMKTMGFDELVLVNPKDSKVLNRVKCREGASGALDVLEKAKICSTLQEALEDTDIWCATGMPNEMYRERRPRDYVTPRRYLGALMNRNTNGNPLLLPPTKTTPASSAAAAAASGEEEENNNNIRISFVFGNERVGMNEEDMDQSHVVLGIPTNPKFGSLNLASAVQLIAYDWREVINGGYGLPSPSPPPVVVH